MRTRLLTAPAIAVFSLLLLAGACGDDDKKETGASADADATIPDIADLDEDDLADAADAAGIDQDCITVALEFQQAFGNAAAAMGSPDSLDDYAQTFTDLGKRLPELKDEFTTIGQAFKDASEGNYASLEDKKYEAASDAVTKYFDEHCSAE